MKKAKYFIMVLGVLAASVAQAAPRGQLLFQCSLKDQQGRVLDQKQVQVGVHGSGIVGGSLGYENWSLHIYPAQDPTTGEYRQVEMRIEITGFTASGVFGHSSTTEVRSGSASLTMSSSSGDPAVVTGQCVLQKK